MDLTKRLTNDHSSFLDMLDVLDVQKHKLLSEGFANRETIADVLNYLSNYPERIHDHLEDLMVYRMLRLDGSLRDLLDGLMEDHAEIERLGSQIRMLLHDLPSTGDEPEDIVRMHKLLEQYCQLWRGHISLEEEQVFPLAQSMLQRHDYEQIIAEHEAREGVISWVSTSPEEAEILRGLSSNTRH